VEHQKKESSEVKSHEEIMVLFKTLKSLEEKVKNPEACGENSIQPETIMQERESPTQTPKETSEEQQTRKPAHEIPLEKKEKRKHPWLKKQDSTKQPLEKKMNRFSFLKRKNDNDPELEVPIEPEPMTQKVKISRSTFTLQLDNDGNLVGFPLKKPMPEKQKKGWFSFRKKTQEESAEPSVEEQAHGIKGKLKRVASKLRRKNASDGESSGGVGSKIKSLFRRSAKE
jgi:hypothetical protein